MSIVINNLEIDGRTEGRGLSSRKSVRVATTTSGTLATSFANGQTIDGVVLATGNRILIKNQASQVENGVYIVQSSGAPERDSDFDEGDDVLQAFVLVEEGSANEDTGWLCVGGGTTRIVGSDPLVFALITGDVSGQLSSTDNAIARWNGTSGYSIQNTSLLIDDSNNMTGLQYLEFNDITAPSNPSAGQGRLYKKTGDDGIWWRPDSAGPEVDLTATGAGGEINTASNVGAGLGWYKTKVGSDLQFKSATAPSGTSGIGLTSNTNDVAISLAIDTLTEDTAPQQSADFVATYDASAGAHKKVLLKNVVKQRDYWDAIADPSGAGDFTTIAAAFLAGNQTVFARDGTYLETSDIVIPDGGYLIGESLDKTIINFQSAAFGIKVDGSGGTSETAGTISVTNGSSAVVGSGTTFTNISLPCFILIEQNYYPVASITNATNLTIGPTYRGPTKSSVKYRLQQMKSHVTAAHFTVINSTTRGLYLRALRHCEFEDIVFRNNAKGIEIVACGNTNFQTIMCQNESGDAFTITDTTSCCFEGCQAFNSGGHGYHINGFSTDVEFSTCQGSHSASNGLYIAGTSTDITVNGSIFNNNKLCGIETIPGTVTTTINGCAMNGNGTYGIDFDGTYNIVDACIIGHNTLSGVRAGDNGTISNNQIFNNGTYGIELEADDFCQVVGNNVYDNTSDGIYTDRNDNTIIGNVITGNVHGVLIEGGTPNNGGHRNIVSNNIIKNNSNDGICVTSGATYNKISGNTCDNNGSDGIELKSNCDNTTVVDNTSTNNTHWGIIVEGDKCIINSNRTSSNGSGGIRIETGYTDVTYYSNNTQGDTPGFSDVGTITSGYESVLANRLDARSNATLQLGFSKATKVEIADSGVITEVQGNLDVLQGLDVTGSITASGYVEFADMSAPGNPGAGLGRLYKKIGDDGIFWKPDAAGPEVDLTTVGSGESNTASNVGSGADVFKQKTGVNLEFRGINPASNKISAAVNGDNIDIDAVEANFTLNNIGGILGVAKGGTNLSSYTIGDIIFASGSTTLAKLADVATGNALISGGVGVAPSYGKIGLTTHVTGTLAIANGGTGQTSKTAAFNALSPLTTKGDIIVRDSTNNIRLAVGTDGQILTADSSQASGVKWSNAPGGGEINTASNIGTSGVGVYDSKSGVDLRFKKLNAASNKLSITDVGVNENLNLDVVEANLALNNLGGTLNVSKGGTGATSLTSGNILQGNGTGAITATLAAPSGAIVGTTDTQTLTNKSLVDASTFIVDDVDNTKKLQFQLSGITTATTRTLTVPDVSDTLVTLGAMQTLTNKTLTAPIIASIVNTGTLTLPTSTDTLVGRSTIDTLTNKTINSANNTITLAASTITSGTLAVARGGTNIGSYTTGDLIFASGTTTLAKLADVATGNALLSGGVGVAPLWGKIGLTTHVSGTLGVANGGTGTTSLTSGRILQGNGTGAITSTLVAPTGAIVGTTDTQTLTNKTITNTSNNVTAKGLFSATTTVDVSAATAPVAGQILTATSNSAATWQNPATKTMRIPHTWGISGEIKVAVGDTDFINTMRVSLPGSQTATLVGCVYRINSGTSATIKLRKGTTIAGLGDVVGFTGMSVTTTYGSGTSGSVALVDNDIIAVVVTGVSGNPKNLSVTVYIEYTV